MTIGKGQLEIRSSTILKNKEGPTATASLLGLVELSLDEDKAEDVVIIDLAGMTNIADFMVIANGGSRRHVGSMADHIQRKIKASGYKAIKAEGLDNCDWVLIDAGDIIVHLFRAEVRDFYKLDKLWTSPPDKSKSETISGTTV